MVSRSTRQAMGFYYFPGLISLFFKWFHQRGYDKNLLPWGVHKDATGRSNQITCSKI